MFIISYQELQNFVDTEVESADQAEFGASASYTVNVRDSVISDTSSADQDDFAR